MKNWLAGWCCLLLCGVAFASSPGGVRKRVQASMLLTGTIVVAPDGSVRSYAIDRADQVEPAAMSLVNRSIPAWKFEPVLLAGKPVAAKATMSLRVVAKPIGDGNYSLAINGTHFGQEAPGQHVTYQNRVPPTYPPQAIKGRVTGTVYLVLRVGRQGQVEDAEAEQVNLAVIASDRDMVQWRNVLAKSALAAARKWTFHTPTSGEYVNAPYWVARVPVAYHLKTLDEPEVDTYGKWQAYVPGPKELVPWIDSQRLLSGSADALPGDGIYQLDRNGLQLLTPLSGA
ncbi:energy transducer TonB [Rhodanobacter sp. FDAARGOS 1247]|uniref:energy transducer TonB n=1 Tax=Rhodanobacter sp. FDAARGOS 1247 TaxID=2778082 RepID=UPI0019520D33|nr:energy transducer TonB [Rhodanobacter sp. FDAARGOS 1247]QRP64339.1 energy transducer TonB [Rhodanobacter sp. FDAARGOS 1247]